MEVQFWDLELGLEDWIPTLIIIVIVRRRGRVSAPGAPRGHRDETQRPDAVLLYRM